MKNNLYVWADLPRTGLGNRLIPWAESLVFAHEHKLQRLYTRWGQLKLGPILRGERDWRFYVGHFRSARSELSWAKSAVLRRLLPVIEPWDMKAKVFKHDRGVVRFWSYESYFMNLYGNEELILDELLNVVAPRQVGLATQIFESRKSAPVVGLHVRLGDFPESGRTPISYFIECFKWIRAEFVQSIRGLLFSDGSHDQLSPLLYEHGVEWIQCGSAISDLLALSLCDTIIGSAKSTFTGWAAFLGGVPLLLDSSLPQDYLSLAPEKRVFQGVFDSRNPDERFVESIRNAMQNPRPRYLKHSAVCPEVHIGKRDT